MDVLIKWFSLSFVAKWLCAVFALWPLCGANCGMQDKAATSIQVGPVKFDDSKNNKIHFDHAEFDPTTRKTVVDNFTLDNNASDANASIPQVTLANREIWRQMGDNFVNGTDAVGRIVTTVMPGVMSAVQGHYSVQATKAMQPSLVGEFVSAIGGGQLGLPQAKSLMNRLPIDIEADVFSNPIVKARLAQDAADLKAALEKSAASQPTP